MKRALIAVLVFCAAAPLAMGAANVVNTSRSNVKDNLISNSTSCTTIGITLDANFNVTGSTSTTAPCSIPQGVYPFNPPGLKGYTPCGMLQGAVVLVLPVTLKFASRVIPIVVQDVPLEIRLLFTLLRLLLTTVAEPIANGAAAQNTSTAISTRFI